MLKGLVDSHVHSRASWDSTSPVEAFCQRALELGLGGVVFTDHLELDPEGRGYGAYDYDSAHREIARVREAYGDRLYLGMGVEVTYRRDLESYVRRYLAGRDFDVLLVSVHQVRGVDCSDPEAAEALWRGTLAPLDLLRAYCDELKAAIQTGWFDVVGHLDVFMRLGARRWEEDWGAEVAGELEECLRLLASTPMALEVNTSGLRVGSGRSPHPGPEMVALYLRSGGTRVTLGSDAHDPRWLGWGFEEVSDNLRRAGLGTFCFYRERRPRWLPLGNGGAGGSRKDLGVHSGWPGSHTGAG